MTAPEPRAAHPAWSGLLALATNVAVPTALLFYFGWARSSATFAYFGVDVRAVDLSTADYLLRSVNASFQPVLAAGLLAAVAVYAHHALLQLSVDGTRWARVTRVLPPAALGVGTALAALGVLGLLSERLGAALGTGLPLALAAGFAAIAYADLTWPAWHGDAGVPWRERSEARSIVLRVLIVLALFWLVALFAEDEGRRRGERFAAGLQSYAEVKLMAVDRLNLGGPGVTVTDVRSAGGKYGWEYRGLRLLANTRQRYFLLPAGWERGRAGVYILDAGPGLRVELIAAK